MNRVLIMLVGGIVLTNCSKSLPSSDNQRATPSATNDQRATAPMAQNPRDINALFANEAAHRPASNLRAEDALAAIRRAGVELIDERQHLARPYGARYCVGAFTDGKGVALSVCEYVDATAAQDGATESRKSSLKNREIRVNRATSLTIREINKTAENDAVSARIFESFAKL